MKEKILAQLVAKFPGVPKSFLLIWAAKLEAKAENDESKIEGVITELDNLPISIPDLALEFQKEGDRRVASVKKPAANPEPKPGEPKPNPEPQPTPQPNGTTQPDNEILTLLKELKGEVAVLKGEKAKTAMQQTVAAKLKGVPADFYSEWALPDSEEGVEAFVGRVNEKFAATKQALAGEGFAASTPPAGGSGGANKVASKEEAKRIVDNIG